MKKVRVLFLCVHNSARSQNVTELFGQTFDHVVTLCGLFWRDFLIKLRKVRDALRTWTEQTFVKGEIHA